MSQDIGEKAYLSHTAQEIDDAIDALPTKAAAADLTAEVTAREKLQAAVTDMIDSGAKNRLQITAENKTHNDITFTVNNDGTVTANGTASANAYIVLNAVASTSELFDGTYVLTGCPAGGVRDVSYALYAALSSYSKYDLGEGVELTAPQVSGNISFVAIVYSGFTADNLVFKPMVCKGTEKAITPEFEPYCPTLPEIYQMILDLGGGNRSMSAAHTEEEEQR